MRTFPNGAAAEMKKAPKSTLTYKVTLSADAIVSGTVEIEANSPEEAREKALALKEEEIQWEVGTLHEEVNECGAVVYFGGKEVL